MFGAIYILNNICVLEPAFSKLEAEENVLTELLRMKSYREAPYIVIRRAIAIQRKRIRKCNNYN